MIYGILLSEGALASQTTYLQKSGCDPSGTLRIAGERIVGGRMPRTSS